MNTENGILDGLKQLLRSRNITRIAIIDDAYYLAPARSFFAEAQLNQLRANIQAWDAPADEFTALNLKIETDEDLTDGVIGQIYGLRNHSPEIQRWFQDYDNVQEQRRAQLKELETVFGTDLSCAVDTLAPDANFDTANLPQLIFVDYYLDPSDRGEDSLILAEGIGKKINDNFEPTGKPFVILMSSKGNVSAAMKTMFREKADFLGGMFYFIPKSELKRSATFLLKLAILMRSVDEGRTIQRFVEAFGAELRGAAEYFNRKVRALSVEDYGYMQHLSLQREGMPLGDYLLWLFGTYFGHLLFRAVPDQRKQLDSMTFVDIPESDSFPSEEFIDLFRNVVAQEVQELETHPRASRQSDQAQPELPPDPHFGDVFITDNRNTLMIITPECDLMYAPESDATRRHRPEQSVLMVPGKLEELGHKRKSDDVVTAFFPLDDKTYQVNWSIKSFESPSFQNLRSSLQARGFRRRARLRHPFSTQIQEAVTTDISRVAIPIPPPIMRKASLTICCQGEGDLIQTTELDSSSAVLFNTHDDECVHLKLQAAVKVIETAQSLIAPLQQKLDAEANENSRRRLSSHIERLQNLATSLDAQIELRNPHAVKPGKSLAIPGTPVEILREGHSESPRIKQRLMSSPIVLVVIDDEPAKESEALQPETATQA